MNKKNLSKILREILHQDIEFDTESFPYEETKGFYKNIYKIITPDKVFVLKKAKDNELEIYQFLNNELDVVPYFYGTYRFYKQHFILIEYVDGHNAMKMDKETLLKIINAIIKVQKKYWMSGVSFATTMELAIQGINKRLQYLPDELKETYEQYIDCFKHTPVTFSHEDLLPFNVLVNKDRAVFLDLEVGGMLPYPSMLARLIAFTEDKKDALFYLSKENYQLALTYYYESFIKQCGISEIEYARTMDLFIFNELIEWVYVYRKNGAKPNDFYRKWYEKALQKANEMKVQKQL